MTRILHSSLRAHWLAAIIIGLLPFGAFIGCHSVDGPQEKFPLGTFKGTVHLFAGWTDTVHQPVTVFIPSLHVSTTSDTFGHWSIPNIPFGTYDVYATSTGYDTLIYFGEMASGETTVLGMGSLGPTPTKQVRINSVVWTANSSTIWPLMVKGSMTAGNFDNPPLDVFCFIDTVPGVPTKAPHFAGPIGGSTGDSVWTAYTGMSALDSVKFGHGMKLYFTACAVSVRSQIHSSTNGNNYSSGMTFNPHTGQGQVFSAGEVSAPYETNYPW
ncbi:MAG: hypothetical protein Q8922_01565 [Bacteroidota bacterium]|nr:hypothetical protein [Bacteroidota bacterium]MDP4232085.1 hypothetical protein [Bacteroidota bacterium]MDP4241208.1 hypothetical protein [Bacteroidota bacterium]MDP4286600.1 hypothetical protein [Bacteroidota bacterium]